MDEDMKYRLGIIEQDVHYTVKVVQDLMKILKKEGLNTEEKQYYSLEDAVRMKYGENKSMSTIKANYLLQPCCNTHFVKLNGKKYWTKDKIDEYLTIQDNMIAAYAKKYGVPLVGRLGERYLRYAKEASK